LVIAPVTQASLVETTILDETARGAGGFGSTGVSDAPKSDTVKGAVA
jgi:dUTP pyrophosphatase